MLFPQTNNYREVINLDGIWDFFPQGDKTDASEVKLINGFEKSYELAVPGSWNSQIGELYHFFGRGWYQKTIFIPSGWAGKRILLRFGSASPDARVWLDGQLVGEHVGAHLPFECDLTSVAKPGQSHLLVVCVDARLRTNSLPSGTTTRGEDRLGFGYTKPDVPYDFFPFAGLNRSVSLYALAPTHISQLKVETDYENTTGTVRVSATIQTQETKCEGWMLSATIPDAIGENKKAITDGVDRVDLKLTIPKVKLWDIHQPNLYPLTVTLYNETKKAVDAYTLQIGVRTVQADKDGITLNGRKIWLTGFGKHEDFPAFGRGHSRPTLVKDFDLLGWTNSNSFRTSHYPYDEEWYDYADRHGILIIGETPFVSLSERLFTEELKETACRVIGEMIARDQNHPSVILWSLANEPNLRSDKGTAFFKAMADTARVLDSTRPVGYIAHEEPETNKAAEHFDWIGVNKYYSWYQGTGEIDATLNDFTDLLKSFHAAYGKPILLSEFGADSIAGCNDQVPLIFTENFQCEVVEKQYRAAAKLPFVFGAHVWNFAEFATGQQLNRAYGNKKGAFTRSRQPKMVAFKLKELFSKNREELMTEPTITTPQLAQKLRQ